PCPSVPRNRHRVARVSIAGTERRLPMEELTLTHDHIRATTVNGTDVFDPDGTHIGHIDDIVLSKRTGNAVYAVMSFGGFLGLGERYHPLPWQSLHYDEN